MDQPKDSRQQFYPFPRTRAFLVPLSLYLATANLIPHSVPGFLPRFRFQTIVSVEKQTHDMRGFAYLRWDTSSAAHFGILVDQSYRGQGIGERLLAEIFDIAECRGVKTLTLTVEKENYPAISLYKKFGFDIIETNSDGAHQMKTSIGRRLPENEGPT